ncbi:MAG TPA: HEAT repeat domain-containing protein, partial [Gemmataceae bacterium]
RNAFKEVLESGEGPLRRLAAEGMGRNAAAGDKIAHDCLLKALNDNDLSVRRAAALAMGRIAAPGAADALVNTLAFDDSGDVYLRDGLLRAIEGLGKPGIDRLLALAESGVSKDTDNVVDAFAALRTRAAYEGLPSLLKYPHLKNEQRVKLLRSCGNYLLDPPITLEPLRPQLSDRLIEEAELNKLLPKAAKTPSRDR